MNRRLILSLLAVLAITGTAASAYSSGSRVPVPCCGFDETEADCQFMYTDWGCPDGDIDCDELEYCCAFKPHIC